MVFRDAQEIVAFENRMHLVDLHRGHFHDHL